MRTENRYDHCTNTLFENLLTYDQLSDLLRVSVKTLRDWVYKRKIPFLKVGKLIRFKRSEIELWITRKENPNAY